VRLAVPFELRIFLVVVLVAAISVLVILDTGEPEPQVLAAAVVQGLQQPGEPSNTLVISGINIGQSIGFKSPSISGNEFACFADHPVNTKISRSAARYYLLLRDPTAGGFPGCRVEFNQNEMNKVGLFLHCKSSEDMFAFIIDFEPTVDSKVVDGKLPDLQDKNIPMFGMPYSILQTEVDTDAHTVGLRFFSPQGTFDISDNFADNEFSDDVQVNGVHALAGRVKILAQFDGQELHISRIEYRFRPLPAQGADVFVPDHQGVKQQLRTPEAFLGDFDILFRGLSSGTGGGAASAPSPAPHAYGGNAIAFQASGGKTYNMIFLNNRGQQYNFPVLTTQGGLHYGNKEQFFFFTGAGAGPPFNIRQNDYFALTSSTDRQGITTILQFNSVDTSKNRIYLQDLSGGQYGSPYDPATGDGSINVGGISYAFRVDPADPTTMTIDQDNDGMVGGTAKMVTNGGPLITFTPGFSATLKVPPELFSGTPPPGGETIGFAFGGSGNNINVDVTSGADLIFNDANDMAEALTQFGIFVQLDEHRDVNRNLIFNMPGAGGSSVGGYATADITGDAVANASATGDAIYAAQAQGEVLITCERSAFVAKAKAAQQAVKKIIFSP